MTKAGRRGAGRGKEEQKERGKSVRSAWNGNGPGLSHCWPHGLGLGLGLGIGLGLVCQ